jgi:hypothetical protein
MDWYITPLYAMNNLSKLIEANAIQLHLLGSVVSDPNRRKDINQRYAIQKLFPDANSRYHDALDKLEDDLFRAKAIMRRDLAALRAEKRKEAKAKEKKAAGLSISPEITKSALPQASAAAAIKMEKQDSTPGVKPEPPTKEPSPVPILTTEPDIPISRKTKPESINLEDETSNEMSTFDIDDLFGDPGDGENENENTVNSIDMTDFHSPSHDVPLLPGLESYANMPDTSLPESSGPDIQAGTSSAMENDNGGLDFSMLGIPEAGADSTAGLGIGGFDETDEVDGMTEEEQKRKEPQDQDDFWNDLQTEDDNGFVDDGGMGEADNSFADLIGFDDLDTGGGEGDVETFDWMLE